jgi:hypothetical protein
MQKVVLGVVAAAATIAISVSAAAAVDGPMGFEPIPGSAYGQASSTWDVPFIVPDGFEQTLVADETTLNIYGGNIDDLTDMNTVNETGIRAGRYLYRTHEVGSNGSVSVVDLETGEAKVIGQNPGWRRLDGLRWTPWGTVLFAEETGGRPALRDVSRPGGSHDSRPRGDPARGRDPAS